MAQKAPPKPVKKKKHYIPTFGLGSSRDYFVENLAMLVGSGMPVLSAIITLEDEMRSSRMKAIIRSLRDDIDAGVSLSRALDDTHLFRSNTISLIRIGEQTGKLAQNLKVVSSQEEKDRMFRSKLRSAMMYPVFVLVLTLVIGIGIAWFILPKLATVFSQLKLELPLITKVLINIGLFLSKYGNIAVPGFILVAGFLLYIIFVHPKTRIIGQTLMLSFPGINTVLKQIELARLGYLLGTLLEAGVPVTQALESMKSATTIPRYSKFYAYLEKNIEEGNSFQKSFSTYPHSKKLIPAPIQGLIIAGEQSGSLPETLIKLSETYEAKTELATKNLAVILEPILLVIVWAGVVLVALAVVLPIYSLIGGLGAP